MKTVFPGQQVCHVWAQQSLTQDEGRNSGKTIFFEGRSIFSYGTHFEMARFVDGVVLITNRRYSTTTAKHLSWVRQAVRHHTTFEVPTFDNHVVNVCYLINQAKDHYDKATRARVRAEYELEYAQEYVEKARGYLATFCAPVPESHLALWVALREGTYLNSEVQADLLRKTREARQAELAKQKERERIQALAESEAIEEWRQGATTSRYFSTVALRVKGDTVQTSRGAEVPIRDAKNLYRALNMINPLQNEHVIGHRVGYFTVNRVTATDIIIGCHTIPLREIERIAPEVMSKALVEA